MPFTPFHLGPGLALKAVGDRHVSLLAFGAAQVAIDIEPLIGLLRGWPVLHGVTHTYAGATVIGAAVALVLMPLAPVLGRWLDSALAEAGLARFQAGAATGRAALWTGSLLGTYSHVALDSLMHRDLHPWRPWSEGNALLGCLDVRTLHLACLAAGVLGAAGWIVRRAVRPAAGHSTKRPTSGR